MMIGFSIHIASKYVRQIQYILWCSVFQFTFSISICCANTWYQTMFNFSIHIASQHVRKIHYISGCFIFQFIYFLNSISTVLSKTIYCSFHQLLQFGWLKGQFKLSSSWPGLWRLRIWKVWNGYVMCCWRIEHALRICSYSEIPCVSDVVEHGSGWCGGAWHYDFYEVWIYWTYGCWGLSVGI